MSGSGGQTKMVDSVASSTATEPTTPPLEASPSTDTRTGRLVGKRRDGDHEPRPTRTFDNPALGSDRTRVATTAGACPCDEKERHDARHHPAGRWRGAAPQKDARGNDPTRRATAWQLGTRRLVIFARQPAFEASEVRIPVEEVLVVRGRIET